MKAERKLILSDPQKYILESPQKINLFMGGTGSGKTFLESIISANFIKHFPEVDGFIGANTYEQLNTSTLKRIRDVWRDLFGLIDGQHYVVGQRPPKGFNTDGHNFDRYDSIISFINGAVIYKASLDNYKAHEGKEFAWAILDETKDTKEEAVKEVILHRLRQVGLKMHGHDFNPLYIGTTPAKVDWINDWFELDRWEDEIASKIYDKDDYFKKEFAHKCVSISSTYHNEENLPKGHIDELLAEHTDRDGKIKESGKRLIFSNPFVKVGGEFYSSFDRNFHTADIEFLPDEPIHISYDFNVVPYITITCWQIMKREKWWEVRCFDEFCLGSPQNTTERATQEFIRKYGNKIRGLYYYGDPTGSARDTRSRRNDYDIIEGLLRPYINNYSKRVRYKAPPVVSRRDFANNIFDNVFDIRILVGRNCKKMIADFEYLKEDADGKKMKTKTTDPDTKQSYEKYGHCMAKGTKISTIKGDVNIEDVRPGDMVLTRYGYRRVLRAGISGRNQTVNTYKIGNKILRCTPEHKIYTLFGFIQAQLLTRWTILCIFEEKKICKKQSFITDTNSISIKAKNIIAGGLTIVRSIYTAICGSAIMVKFQRGITYTTKTMTRLITQSRILNAPHVLSTCLNITIDYPKRLKIRLLEYLTNSQGQRLVNGMDLMLAGSGTENTQPLRYLENQEKFCVKNVGQNLKQELSQMQSFVLRDVRVGTICDWIESQENGMRTGHVLSAKRNSQSISGQKHKLAVERVQLLSGKTEPEVYNLHIDEHHEYFANQVLVKNCSDSFDYFITEAFATHFKL